MDKNEKADKPVKKLDNKYDNHVEMRFHKAKKAILPQLDAAIKVSLNLNDVCTDICTKFGVTQGTFKEWVQEQIPPLAAVEDDPDVSNED